MPIRKVDPNTPPRTGVAQAPSTEAPLAEVASPSDTFKFHLETTEELNEESEELREPLACLITGDVGVGKSSFAATFPLPFVVFLAMGEKRTVEKPYEHIARDSIRWFDIDKWIVYEDRKGFTKLIAAMRSVARELNGGTIIIESVHQLAHHFRGWCGISRSEFLKPWGDEEYRYQKIGDVYRQLLPELIALPRDVNIAAVCATGIKDAVLDKAGRMRQPMKYGLKLQGQWMKDFYNDWPQVIRLHYKEGVVDGAPRPQLWARLKEDGSHSFTAKINMTKSEGLRIPIDIGPDPTYDTLHEVVYPTTEVY